MIYQIVHRTVYTYAEAVAASHHTARLTPRTGPGQRCTVHRLEVDPVPVARSERTDYFGNAGAFFSVERPHQRLEVVAHSLVEFSAQLPPAPDRTPPWEAVAAQFREPVAASLLEAAQFVFPSPFVRPWPALAAFAREAFGPEQPVLAAALALNRQVHQGFHFDPEATTVTTTVEEVFERRRGVCQDFTHLMLGALRALGLPARYVSGYLHTRSPADGPRLEGADVSHAWVSLYCPGYGWVDLDPTNDLLVRDEHVTVAVGRDFSDVSPLSGVILGGGPQTVRVGVDMRRV